jgi:hypothetical protein
MREFGNRSKSRPSGAYRDAWRFPCGASGSLASGVGLPYMTSIVLSHPRLWTMPAMILRIGAFNRFLPGSRSFAVRRGRRFAHLKPTDRFVITDWASVIAVVKSAVAIVNNETRVFAVI